MSPKQLAELLQEVLPLIGEDIESDKEMDRLFPRLAHVLRELKLVMEKRRKGDERSRG